MMNTSTRTWLAPLGLVAALASLAALTQCGRDAADAAPGGTSESAEHQRGSEPMDPILNPLGTLAAPPKNLAPTTERQPAWVAGQQVDGQQVAGKGQRVAGQQVEDQQVASRDSETEITRVTLTNAVEGREPLKAERFEAGKPVIAFFEAKNSSDQPRTVQVVFEDKAAGTRVGFVKLEIPGKATRWRTWAKTERIRKAGEWTVIIEDETGAALSQTSFTVAGPVMEPVEAKAAPASPDSMPLQSAKSHGESHHGT